MESVRGSSLRRAVSLSNAKSPGKFYYIKGETCCNHVPPLYSTGTHCLIEWDEPGSPVSIVERKNVKAVDGDSELSIGDVCSVRCRERSKWVEYPGKLLAQGLRKEMELEMARLDNLATSSDEEEEECGEASSRSAKKTGQAVATTKRASDEEEERGEANSRSAKKTGQAVATRKRANPTTTDDEAGEQAPKKRRQIVSGS